MSHRHDTGDTNRLAALALGLAFAGRDRQTSIEQLLEEADGNADLLAEARSRVVGLLILDHDRDKRGAELLEAALGRIDTQPNGNGNGGRTLRPAS